MLSLAYGDDQRADLTAHKPEVCYPAQGFQLHSNAEDELATPFGQIAVRRLNTSLGARKEPVTYWFTVGDRAIRSKLDQRIVEVRLGLTGQIPDGLLFRVSSIDPEPSRAYVEQDKFVAELLKAVSARDRIRLAGSGTGDTDAIVSLIVDAPSGVNREDWIRAAAPRRPSPTGAGSPTSGQAMPMAGSSQRSERRAGA